MQVDYNNRGRAYQCRKCPKVLRKGRMISHVLKHHVALDRVPYSCTLCKFTCLDKDTLREHIDSYKRHVDAEAQLEERPNYAEILNMAADPYQVGEKDMVLLSKEASRQLWRTRCGKAFQRDDPFEDDDDDDEPGVVVRGGKLFPTWMFEGGNLPTSSAAVPVYQPTPLSKLRSDSSATQSQISYTNSLTTSQFDSLNLPPALQPPVLSFPQSSHQLLYPQQTLAMTRSTPVGQQLAGLNTPLVRHESPAANTPCLDENTAPPILNHDAENQEESSEEPTKKRVKTSYTQTSTSQGDIRDALLSISGVIDQGFQSVVLALEGNARAIRCQDKTLERAVEEMDKILRRLR